MITHALRILAALAAILAGVALAGCGTLKRAVARPLVIETNLAPVVVEVPARTNYAPAVVTIETPAGPVLETNILATVTPRVLVTNWQTNIAVNVNPALATTLKVASQANRLANPTPTAPFVELGLLALSGALGAYARWKQKRLQREIDAHAGTHEMLEAVITGVEVAKQPETKAAIAEVAKQWRVARQLDSKVQDTVKAS